jgi:hypothetical protein
MAINRVDFSYEFEYQSRHNATPGLETLTDSVYNADYLNKNKWSENDRRIRSNAILYTYDYENSFDLPRFQFSKKCVRDYHKINAMPYNEFFWQNNDEFKIIDFENRNDAFYSQQDVITNRTWFFENKYFKKVYEAPFITWSDKRILMKDVSGNYSPGDHSDPKALADMYKLGVKIFMDINTYSDSTNVITSTVFDPWDTFYLLPVDSVTNCFLNIYFDICEIERRKFAQEIREKKYTKAQMFLAYDEVQKKIEQLTDAYLKEVERGTNRKQLEKWNRYDMQSLGIDNMSLFNLNRQSK